MTRSGNLPESAMPDFRSPSISALIAERGWQALPQKERVGGLMI